MPVTLPQRRGLLVDRLLIWVGVGFIAIGGWNLAKDVANLGSQTGAVTTITQHGTTLVTTDVRTIKRVVHGRVIHLPGDQVVVRVPMIVVHTDHHTIKVPAHTLPLRSASATVALTNVPVTVYVTMPGPTPDPVTVTVTSTATSTTTELVPTTETITVTLPLEEGGPDT